MAETERNDMNQPKTPRPKTGVAIGAGGLGLGFTITWIWGMVFPEHPMPVEVAQGMSAFISFVAAMVMERMRRPL